MGELRIYMRTHIRTLSRSLALSLSLSLFIHVHTFLFIVNFCKVQHMYHKLEVVYVLFLFQTRRWNFEL